MDEDDDDMIGWEEGGQDDSVNEDEDEDEDDVAWEDQNVSRGEAREEAHSTGDEHASAFPGGSSNAGNGNRGVRFDDGGDDDDDEENDEEEEVEERRWLGNDGEIVLELPRDDEGDEGHEDGDSAGGEGLRNEGGVGGKGKKKAKPHRFTAEEIRQALSVHKTHLACLVARCSLVSRWAGDPAVQAAMVSCLPTELLCRVPNTRQKPLNSGGAEDSAAPIPAADEDSSRSDGLTLASLVVWFKDFLHILEDGAVGGGGGGGDGSWGSRPSRLLKVIDQRVGCAQEAVQLFVALCRGLGLRARYVACLDPLPPFPRSRRSSKQTLRNTVDLAESQGGTQGSGQGRGRRRRGPDSRGGTGVGLGAGGAQSWAEILCQDEETLPVVFDETSVKRPTGPANDGPQPPRRVSSQQEKQEEEKRLSLKRSRAEGSPTQTARAPSARDQKASVEKRQRRKFSNGDRSPSAAGRGLHEAGDADESIIAAARKTDLEVKVSAAAVTRLGTGKGISMSGQGAAPKRSPRLRGVGATDTKSGNADGKNGARNSPVRKGGGTPSTVDHAKIAGNRRREGKGSEAPIPGNPTPTASARANGHDINGAEIGVDEGSQVARAGPSGSRASRVPGDGPNGVQGDCTSVMQRRRQRWVHVDPVQGAMDQAEKVQDLRFRKRAMPYVVGEDDEGFIVDVTRRYSSEWARTLRTRGRAMASPDGWWNNALRLWGATPSSRGRSSGGRKGETGRADRPLTVEGEEGAVDPEDYRACEEKELAEKVNSEPVPSTIAGLKNHHVYVLGKNLLKFEGLRPGAKATGLVKGCKVYLKSDVFQLKGASRWKQDGLKVKDSELDKPAKVTTKKGEKDGEGSSKLYGDWQTESWTPEAAVDGKVPKNEYGNVEFFKCSPAFLPPGTEHIRGDQIGRVAAKLGVDYAPALTGFETKQGRQVPVLDGIIVCKEQIQMLRDAHMAWEQTLLEKQLKARGHRVLKRWTTLFRGVMLGAKLLEEYGDHD